MRIDCLLIFCVLLLFSCTSADSGDFRSGPDLGAPPDASPSPDARPSPDVDAEPGDVRPDLPEQPDVRPDVEPDMPLGPVSFELGSGDPFVAAKASSALFAEEGPQGGHHLSFMARLRGDVRAPDLDFTQLRVEVADASTGETIGFGFWEVASSQWTPQEDAWVTELPRLFLDVRPSDGQRVQVAADAFSTRSLGSFEFSGELRL